MTNKYPLISIIIPVYNEEEYLPYCLDSLIKQDYPKDCYEIIIVDNESTDSSVEIAKNKGVSVISSDADYVGGVRNAGVKVCKGQVLVFIDSDCVANESWISTGVELLLNSTKSAVGGLYLLRESPSFFEKYWVLDNGAAKKMDCSLLGGCIFVNKSDFIAIDGFAENLTAGEDSQLSKDLCKKQSGFLVSPSLSVVHLGYPRGIRSFSERQIWHSSSFTQNLRASILEPMFVFILLHSILAIISVAFFLCYEPSSALAVASLFFVLPLVLSLKRVKSANCWKFAAKHIFQIYWVDFIYLCARDFGVMASLFKKVLGLKLGKSRK